MADITGASLGSIKNRLSGAATYHPMEAETFSDWATEAGDVVTVKRGNESYNSPVYSSKLVWKGAPQMTLSSTGNKERESLQKVSSKKYRKNGAAVRNSQNQRYFVEDLYKQMRAGLDLTMSSASLYVESKYDAMKSGLDLTMSSASLYVESKYDAMKSGLDLTMSSASLYVESKYDAMKSGLDLTMSSASLYVESKYDAMKSGLDLTMSSASLYVESKYDAMKSGLDLTMSSASLYVESKYDAMKSGLDLTSSSAAVYVESLYNQMKAGLDVTSSSAALYAESRTTKAQIIARINGAGKSEALIEAENIKIGSRNNSDIKLNDRISIDSSGNLEVGGNLFVSLTGSPDYYVRTKKVKLIGASSSQNVDEADLTYSDVENMIIQAEVYNNTLYLWKKGDSLSQRSSASFSFSKAVTLSGSWSNGTLTINVTPDVATNTYKRTFEIPTTTTKTSDKVATVTLYARTYTTSNPPTIVDDDLVGTYPVNVTENYNAGWDYGIENKVTCSGPSTKTLSYGEVVSVSTKVTNSSGNSSYPFAATYTAPADRYNDGWDYGIANKVTCSGPSTKTLSYGEVVSVSTKVTNSAGNSSYPFAATYTAPAAASHSVSSFNVSAPASESLTISGTSYSNNTSGYYLSSTTSRTPTVYIITKGTWTCDGISKSGKSYLGAAPKAIYTEGWDNGQASLKNAGGAVTKTANSTYTLNQYVTTLTVSVSASASHTITEFSTTNTTNKGVNVNGEVRTTNAYGYHVKNGKTSNVSVIISTQGTWKCDGNSKSGESYLMSSPTAIYKKGWADFYNAGDDYWDDCWTSDGTHGTTSCPSTAGKHYVTGPGETPGTWVTYYCIETLATTAGITATNPEQHNKSATIHCDRYAMVNNMPRWYFWCDGTDICGFGTDNSASYKSRTVHWKQT